MFRHARAKFRTENPRVAGSIPALGTIFPTRFQYIAHGDEFARWYAFCSMGATANTLLRATGGGKLVLIGVI